MEGFMPITQKTLQDEESVKKIKKESCLNFKVTPELKKEFKVFAALQGMSMVDLLKEGFALSKESRK